MELDYEANTMFVKVQEYVKEVENTKTCMICVMDETTEHCQKWSRTELKCGHIAHSRCFRKWCYIQQKVSCPICREELSNKDRYCHICKEYGHSAYVTDCPNIEKVLNTKK